MIAPSRVASRQPCPPMQSFPKRLRACSSFRLEWPLPDTHQSTTLISPSSPEALPPTLESDPVPALRSPPPASSTCSPARMSHEQHSVCVTCLQPVFLCLGSWDKVPPIRLPKQQNRVCSQLWGPRGCGRVLAGLSSRILGFSWLVTHLSLHSHIASPSVCLC